MEQRDYLMRQIEQLGQVLAQMLARLLGIKQRGKGNIGLEEIRQTYKNELDIDLEELIKIPEYDLIAFLIGKNKNFENHFEVLADILKTTAENYLKNNKLEEYKSLLRKSILILEYLQTSGKDYSMNRMLKIKDYQEILKNLNL